ncbi:hypothetical protein B0T24DRAFT_194391 [Lasiosphaeria ovina]|uniref:Uncharacterized protein n=1 Tax=Lasiosphaeria ovina TaxID=92902 RepID=A0AAE0NFA0_9PEZI|nr:hypothetical protein B0T24DRAFT_194391 [Lasiosphaeria ovina]
MIVYVPDPRYSAWHLPICFPCPAICWLIIWLPLPTFSYSALWCVWACWRVKAPISSCLSDIAPPAVTLPLLDRTGTDYHTLSYLLRLLPRHSSAPTSPQQALGTVFLLWYLGVPVPGAPANPRYLRAPFSASTYTACFWSANRKCGSLLGRSTAGLPVGALALRLSGTQALWSSPLHPRPPPSPVSPDASLDSKNGRQPLQAHLMRQVPLLAWSPYW